MKDRLIADANDTIKCINSKRIKYDSREINLENYIDKTKSVEYRTVDKVSEKSGGELCNLIIKPYSSTDAVFDMKLQKEKKAILNFASSKNPGGAWRRGAVTQEEALCRSSNLGIELEKHMSFYEFNREHINNGIYADGILYNENVVFFKSNGTVKQPVVCDVITCAAPNAGVALKHGVQQKKINDTLYKRLEQIVNVAIQHEIKVLVLGAFGCGVFKNSPEFVAESIMSLREIYGNYFSDWVMPLMSKSDTNYKVFSKVMNNGK